MIERSFILKALTPLKNPRLYVTPDDAGKALARQVPEDWWALASLEAVPLEALRRLWQPVATSLPETMAELEATLQGVAVLAEADTPPSLLYVFEDRAGAPIFYQGFAPLRHAAIPARWRPAWDQLPQRLRALYAVHDGWYLIFSHSGGHLPIAQWSLLSGETWRLEQQLLDRMPIDPARTLVVYAQGGGGYLGFQLPPPGAEGLATPLELWSRDLAHPRVGIDFQARFDAWTSAVMVEMTLRTEEV